MSRTSPTVNNPKTHRVLTEDQSSDPLPKFMIEADFWEGLIPRDAVVQVAGTSFTLPIEEFVLLRDEPVQALSPAELKMEAKRALHQAEELMIRLTTLCPEEAERLLAAVRASKRAAELLAGECPIAK